MAQDITKVKLGPCNVTFNGADLGHTIGGVEVHYEPMFHDIMVDKYGKTVVEKVLIGEKFMAKVPLAQPTIANIAIAAPQGVANATKITLGSVAGKKGSAAAYTLVLHPSANAAGDRSEDVVMYKALVTSLIKLVYNPDKERIVECEFTAIPDETRVDGNLLGLIGDSTT